MFERFTSPAREVVVLAQEHADELGHDYIGTEHLLLGLLEDRQSPAGRVLERLGVKQDVVRDEVVERIGRGRPTDRDALAAIGIDLDEVRRRVEEAFGEGALERTRAGRRFCRMRPLTPRSKKSLQLALDQARKRGDGFIGSEHLLLGLIEEGRGVAARVLCGLGVTEEAVLTELGR